MADFSIQALHDEFEAQKVGAGGLDIYPANWKTADDDRLLEDIINNTDNTGRNNSGTLAALPYSAANLRRDRLPDTSLVYALDFTEFQTLTTAEIEYLKFLIGISGESINVNESEVFDALNGEIFRSGKTPDAVPNTRANLLAIMQYAGARAQELWGENKIVSLSEIGAATNL